MFGTGQVLKFVRGEQSIKVPHIISHGWLVGSKGCNDTTYFSKTMQGDWLCHNALTGKIIINSTLI